MRFEMESHLSPPGDHRRYHATSTQQMKLSLRSLFLIIGIVAMAAWVISRPFHTVRSVNCGDGVYVQILCPNESAEVLHRAFYNSNGLDLKEPVEFGHMPIGSKLEIVALTSENDDCLLYTSPSPRD